MNMREHLEGIITALIKELRKNEEIELFFISKHTALTRFANNSITQNIDQSENSVTLRLKVGKKVLNLSSNSLNQEHLRELLMRGRDTIEYVKEIQDVDDLLGPQEYAKINAFNEKIATFSPAQRREIVENTVNLSKKYECEANGTVSNTTETVFIGNSNNLRAYFENTLFEFRIVPKFKEATSFNSFSSTTFERFNLEQTVIEAIELARMSINPQQLEEGRYTVVFSPQAVTNFLEFLGWYGLNTKNIYEKSVILSEKMGERVFSDKITMYDDYR
ncbi:MAG: metallopeptidase TldD-related protein, partial [Planctomycetota bacterium]